MDPKPSHALVPTGADYARPVKTEPITGEYYGYSTSPSASTAMRGHLRLLQRRLRLILLIFAATMAVGIGFLLTSTPTYRATAEILVTPTERGGGATSPDLADSLGGFMRVRSVATQIKVMGSADLLDEAFAALPESLRRAGFGTNAKRLSGYPIVIDNPKDTDIIVVHVTARNPDAAAEFANRVMQTALSRRTETIREMARLATGQVSAELETCQANLLQARNDLATLKRTHGLPDFTEAMHADVQALAALEAQATQASLDLRRAQLNRQSLRQELRQTSTMVERERVTADNPVLHTIDTELERLEQRRTELLQEYLPTANEVRTVDRQITSLKQRKQAAMTTQKETVTTARNPLLDTLREQYMTSQVSEQEAQSRLAHTRAEAERQRKRLAALPDYEKRVSLLMSRIAELDSTHKYLTGQRQELSLSMHGGLPNVMPITLARANPRPVSPNVKSTLVLTFLLAVLAALGVAILFDQFDDRINTVDTLEQQTHQPVLASLPQVRNGFQGLVTDTDCPLGLLESFRILRGNIFLTMPDPLPRVILVSSARSGEGKSTTVANLAVTIALAGKRVLIVDGDLRHPSVHLAYRLPNTEGLSDVLDGRTTAEACIRATEYPTLHVLTAGRIPEHPTELLASTAMIEFLAGVREQYDCIILDSVPLLNLSDGAQLAALAEGVVLVVSSTRTRQPELQRTLRILDQIGCPVIGLVYNRSHDLPALQWAGDEELGVRS